VDGHNLTFEFKNTTLEVEGFDSERELPLPKIYGQLAEEFELMKDIMREGRELGD